jgi:hypothetical protein
LSPYLAIFGSFLKQKALKLHHTKLDGRRINVEMTAGGGGKYVEFHVSEYLQPALFVASLNMGGKREQV